MALKPLQRKLERIRFVWAPRARLVQLSLRCNDPNLYSYLQFSATGVPMDVVVPRGFLDMKNEAVSLLPHS